MIFRVLMVTLALTAPLAVLWHAHALRTDRARAQEAARDLQEARALQADIAALRAAPAVALAPGTSDADLLRLLQRAATDADLPATAVTQLVLDQRAEVLRTAAASITRRTGRMNLSDVTLPQLGRLLAQLRVGLPPVRFEQVSVQRARADSADSADARLRVTISFAAMSTSLESSPSPPAALQESASPTMSPGN
jgi:hypothetical protein